MYSGLLQLILQLKETDSQSRLSDKSLFNINLTLKSYSLSQMAKSRLIHKTVA